LRAVKLIPARRLAVSLALAFAERALNDLRGLDIWLQEEAFDELDRLADATSEPSRRHLTASVHDFVRERDGARHYVFVTYERDDIAGVLNVHNVGVFRRPSS
jgi:hypothetical protein